MVQITGSYKLERNENLDEFYQKVGVPWIARKMMLTSSPTIHVTKDDEEQWNFKTVTFFRTIENSFKLDEEYEETMPGGRFQSITRMDGDSKFVTKSKAATEAEEGDTEEEEKEKEKEKESGLTFERQYEFNDDGMIMTLQSPAAEKVAKRYFKRIQ